MGIQLVVVSVGLPEKGQYLADHLGVDDAGTLLFVDPENALYDALDLNRGAVRTFFDPRTAFSFLDRMTTEGGMKDVMEVLSKYSKALFIPPKLEQGFLQGGTFVFSGPKTLFAHYDPSTAAHASIDEVIEVAVEELKVTEL